MKKRQARKILKAGADRHGRARTVNAKRFAKAWKKLAPNGILMHGY